MKIKYILLLCAGLSFMPGCITTRSSLAEEKEKTETKQTIVSLREGNVQLEDRVTELQEQFRDLNGKLEVSDGQLRRMSQDQEVQTAQLDEKWKALSARFDLLVDSVTKLEEKMGRLSQDVDRLRDDAAKAKTAPPVKRSRSSDSSKGNYQQAESDFENKKWKEAALGYQKYRELNPKGKSYAKATFRMGVCFKNLNLNSEARVFFTEVVDRFPKSAYFKDASSELKKLK